MFTPLEELKSVHNKMRPYIHNTPVLTSSSFNKLSGSEVWFKCENFQKMGAFKMRGAINAIMKIPKKELSAGVITHSSGNFGQAVSLSARIMNIKAVVVMPHTAPTVKKDAVRNYGAKIVECEPGLQSREETTMEIIRKTGAKLLHPSNHKDVIDGNASACLELLDAVPTLETIIAPVGGGGLLAGTSLAAKGYRTAIRVYAGEPSQADDAWLSMQRKEIQPSVNPVTVADGLKTQLGDQNFPIILKHVTEIIRVEEYEIIEAMKWIWSRMKIIIEPSSAVAVAAVLKSPQYFRNKKTGIIISGGNVDLNNLPF